MSARGDFRNNASKRCMLLQLAEHNIGQDRTRPGRMAPHNRRGGFVAARFQPKNSEVAQLSADDVLDTPCT